MAPAAAQAAPVEEPADAWHARPAVEVLRRLSTNPERGLAAEAAAARLATDGRNELDKSETPSPLVLLAGQFHSLIIWVLIGAAIVSAALGEVVDAVAILAIVVLNALVGFLQEYRAERAVAALARMVAPRAKVVRDGLAAVVPAAEVVRGDVLLLEGGDLIAADARLLEARALRTVEASLTGESEPVEKTEAVAAVATALADRANMVFLGTSVASGTGRAVVVATGMRTEMGHIAALLEGASITTSAPICLAMARRLSSPSTPMISAAARVRQLTGGGADVAIEALGTQETFENALRCLRPGGTLSSLGVYSGKLQVPHDAFATGIGDHRIVTTLCPGGKERMRRLIELVRSGRLDLTPLLTHSFALRDIREAYALFGERRQGVIKVAIRP